jgi:hypothetical protein
MVEWFCRLADIPGVGYIGRSDIQRSSLPGYNAIPKIVTYTYDEKQSESLMWPTSEGETSSSPAKVHGFFISDDHKESPQAMLQRVYEALELPGEATDYHFIMQVCITALWKSRPRQQDALFLQHLEQLCWLDIQLIEAKPEAITYDQNGTQQYFNVSAFDHLIRLYEREGFLHEAFEVTQRAAKFYPDMKLYTQLRQRLGQLEAEDNAGHTAV